MRTVREIYDALFAFAPETMKLGDWDNVGLLCGRFDREVETVLVALDPLPDVIEEAQVCGAQCIVTHHPLFFQPPRAINETALAGRSILTLIERGIAAINLHTNLDCAPGGVNDVLAERLELEAVRVLHPNGEDASGRPYGLIRVGETAETDVRTFAGFVQAKLNCPGLRFADAGKPVRLVVKWCFAPEGHPDGSWRTSKPDTDNLEKALKDEMTRLHFWHDDAQVCSEIVEKFWADPCGVFVRLEVWG